MNLFSSSKVGFADIESDMFETKISNNKGSILIDVRTKEEFSEERIKDSILIDIYKPDFYNKIDQLDRNNSYYIYCKSGVRSLKACQQMVKMGFREVYNLRGGIISWQGEVINK